MTEEAFGCDVGGDTTDTNKNYIKLQVGVSIGIGVVMHVSGCDDVMEAMNDVSSGNYVEAAGKLTMEVAGAAAFPMGKVGFMLAKTAVKHGAPVAKDLLKQAVKYAPVAKDMVKENLKNAPMTKDMVKKAVKYAPGAKIGAREAAKEVRRKMKSSTYRQ